MRILLALAAAGLLVSPAHSQQPSNPAADQPDDIVVKAPRSQKKRVSGFVRTLTPVRAYEQIGRYHYPICPGVIGLGQYDAEVAKRLREVAKASGVPVAPEKCTANLLVIATPNKKIFIDSIARYAPGLTRGISAKKVKALARAPGPVASWQVTGFVDENGIAPTKDQQTGWLFFSSMDASRLRKMTQVSFDGSVLIVERPALAGVSTRQLADFAAMRTLAPVDPLSYRHALSNNPDSELPAPSILDLFDEGAAPSSAPASVTWWDFAFLQALYDSAGNFTANIQRSEIQHKMSRILANVPADEL
jgi:hypothetical protein